MLTGLFAADEGDVTVDGLSMRTQARGAARIGVVFQQMSLDLDLSVAAQPAVSCRPARPAARRVARERIRAAVDAFGLRADLPRAARELSGGNRRKVELVRALLHRPPLLLMDEPTVGLDPKSRRDLLAAIRADVAERGTAVLWATHLVDEAEGADRVLVLHKGQLLADGTPAQVRDALGGGVARGGFHARHRLRPCQGTHRMNIGVNIDQCLRLCRTLALATMAAAPLLGAGPGHGLGVQRKGRRDHAGRPEDAGGHRHDRRPASARATCRSRRTASVCSWPAPNRMQPT